jgi:hypothetical protein
MHSVLDDDTSPLVFTSIPVMCLLRSKMELQVPALSHPPLLPNDRPLPLYMQLRAAFDADGRLRSIWYEDKSCTGAVAACNKEIPLKVSKLLLSLTTVSVTITSEAPALLAKVPAEIKASYAPNRAADQSKEKQVCAVSHALLLLTLHSHFAAAESASEPRGAAATRR